METDKLRVVLLRSDGRDRSPAAEKLCEPIEGFVVVKAVSDPDRALAAVEETFAQAVLAHVRTPDRAFLEKLRKLSAAAAVVVAAERFTDEEANNAILKGAQDVLSLSTEGLADLPLRLRNAVRRWEREHILQAALEHAEEKARDLASCLSTTRAILTSDNMVEALSLIYAVCKHKMGTRAGYVAVLAPDGQANDLVVMDMGDGREGQGMWSCIPVLPWQEEAFRRGRPVIAERLDGNSAPDELPEWHRNLANVCFAPLLTEAGPVGMIVLAGKRGCYDTRDMETVEMFSGLAGAAIQNARNREEVHRARQEWENIFQAIGQSAVVLSPEHAILDANRSTAELLGLSQEEIVGRKCYELFHRTDAPPPDCALALLARQGYLGSVTAEAVTCKGAFLVSATPILDTEGRVEKIIHIATDINPIRRMQDELIANKSRFEQLFDSMSSGVAIFTPADDARDFILCELNRAAEKIVHVKREEVLGKGVVEAFPGILAMGLLRLFTDVWKTKRKGYLPRTLYRDERVSFWAENHVYPLEDGRVVAVFDDVTEKVRSEEQRLQMEVQLRHQQKMEAIGLLAGGVAHEINNPIHGIMSYAQLIKEDGGAVELNQEYAGEIIAETKRIAAIVNNLLTFARQEEQRHSPASVSDILEATMKLVRSKLLQDQIGVSIEVEPDLPMVRCRSQQIQHVLLNLLTNSRDALNERYPGYNPKKRIEIAVRREAAAGAGMVRITVTDFGTGIDPSVAERIFDPFFTTKPKEVGTGLGLAISHGIVREHKGSLRLETRVGDYTSFHLDLPQDNGWRISPDRPETEEDEAPSNPDGFGEGGLS
ncbi:MAG: ATP-binding protein [Thermodesulfobacteriota bacterium]